MATLFVMLTVEHHAAVIITVIFLHLTFSIHVVIQVNIDKQWCCVYWYLGDVPEASTFLQQQYLAMATLFVMLTVEHHAAVIITVIFLHLTFSIHVVIQVNIDKQWCCVYWYLGDVPEANTLSNSGAVSIGTLEMYLRQIHCQTVVLCLLVLQRCTCDKYIVKQWCCVYWYFRDVTVANTFLQHQQFLAKTTLLAMLTAEHQASSKCEYKAES